MHTQGFAVLGRRTAEARFAAGDRSLTPFIGREHELGLLLDLWEQTKSGDGQVVWLSGEAGIGKSRLLNALCERLNQASCMTLRYQCSPYLSMMRCIRWSSTMCAQPASRRRTT